MSKRHLSIPTLRHQKATGQAFVRFQRLATPIYLGKFGLAETSANYDRIIQERLTESLLPATAPNALTIAELIAHFWEHAQTYYRYSNGEATTELASLRSALQPMLDLYATERCVAFGPKALKLVRQHMIRKGWARRQINKQIGRIRMAFRWATEEELIPPGVHQALAAVRGLQQGRSDAPETPPIKPAKAGLIEAISGYVSATIFDMVRVQRLCGCRPQDIIQLRRVDIDRSNDVWVANIVHHKTAWRGQTHNVYLGPKSQEILKPYLYRRCETEFLFSPAESAAQRRMVRQSKRVTDLKTGNRPGTNQKPIPKRKPGSAFKVAAYCRAVTRACNAAFPLPVHLAKAFPGESQSHWRLRLGEAHWTEKEQWNREHRFTPNQLRHTAATELRRRFGIDVAQTVLGHKIGSAITEIYAEANIESAIDAARAIG